MLASNCLNGLSLAGKVHTLPNYVTTPNGVKHCRFILEHRSQRQEAGFNRPVWCRIPVQISGEALVAKAQSITIGSSLVITGFLISQQMKNGMFQLVLHAEHIELID